MADQKKTQQARKLRKQQTEVEKHLWHYLRNRNINGYKFKRQYIVGNYIADFACIEKRLIVELDGSQHFIQAEYDQQRTHYLQTQGYTVLRFWDNEVFNNTEGVLEKIMQHLKNKPSP